MLRLYKSTLTSCGEITHLTVCRWIEIKSQDLNNEQSFEDYRGVIQVIRCEIHQALNSAILVFDWLFSMKNCESRICESQPRLFGTTKLSPNNVNVVSIGCFKYKRKRVIHLWVIHFILNIQPFHVHKKVSCIE